jgi:hypothetical protein
LAMTVGSGGVKKELRHADELTLICVLQGRR